MSLSCQRFISRELLHKLGCNYSRIEYTSSFYFNGIKLYNVDFTSHRLFSTNKLAKNDKGIPEITGNDSVPTEYDAPIKYTKDQWLYKASDEDVKLFKNSKLFPTRPISLENSIVVKLVNLNDSVTSPVHSAILYSEYGLKRDEFIQFILFTIVTCTILLYLGFWQLRRREWKIQLLSQREKSLNSPRVTIDSFKDVSRYFVQNDGSCDINAVKDNILYRQVEARGVLDTNKEFLVGPRQSPTHTQRDQIGYYVVYPLRFRDGSSVLVNMGWLKRSDVFSMKTTPEWITIRGVIVDGEIIEKCFTKLRIDLLAFIDRIISYLFNYETNFSIKYNKPRLIKDGTRVYTYLDPRLMGAEIISKSPSDTKSFMINAYDSFFENDSELVTHEQINSQEKNTMDYLFDVFGKIFSKNQELEELIPANNLYGPKSHIGRINREKGISSRYSFERKQKPDYLSFYADPETHFNYAAQWFLMALSICGLCAYKILRIRRISKIR